MRSFDYKKKKIADNNVDGYIDKFLSQKQYNSVSLSGNK